MCLREQCLLDLIRQPERPYVLQFKQLVPNVELADDGPEHPAADNQIQCLQCLMGGQELKEMLVLLQGKMGCGRFPGGPVYGHHVWPLQLDGFRQAIHKSIARRVGQRTSSAGNADGRRKQQGKPGIERLCKLVYQPASIGFRRMSLFKFLLTHAKILDVPYPNSGTMEYTVYSPVMLPDQLDGPPELGFVANIYTMVIKREAQSFNSQNAIDFFQQLFIFIFHNDRWPGCSVRNSRSSEDDQLHSVLLA
ncbi:hypothetical protein D3C74_349320 [compost metagenome]